MTRTKTMLIVTEPIILGKDVNHLMTNNSFHDFDNNRCQTDGPIIAEKSFVALFMDRNHMHVGSNPVLR